ncbi:ATP-NAD kinase-like domain-containing protein [Lasiosphaeria miniovina]|uniref:ATP-NAD kinase-like domain-containing protein n=1 Tax=Lasiosphaeria miniovina TaxID=1954250 RepID=A0AA39ZQI9_9PEZI|nr:ATP-NAD kinase-like domain-containing protein [Lasiosphaeria miniovina]KAK0701739.1 ATP-NAD kinase-like domain-containing protein [Lasiosphaeria miniovina]
MAAQVPRTAADIQPPLGTAPYDHAHHVKYQDGELVWAAQGGDIEQPQGRVKRDDIVAVLKAPEGTPGYLVYSLAEAPEGEQPFKLSVLLAPQLPEEPLAEFLLADMPAHFAVQASHLLHVIVSTRSGTGQATAFFDHVLRPLLAALGLEAHTEPDLPAMPGSYRVTATQSPHTVRDFARSLGVVGTSGATSLSGNGSNVPSAPTILLLSGDGGVIDLLNGVGGSSSSAAPPTVALLPLGTGNALFHSLHKPLYSAAEATGASGQSPLVLGLRTLLRGASAPLPTFRASFSPGSRLVAAPEGIKAAVVAEDGDGDAHASGDEHDHPPIDHLVGAIVASYGFHASLVWVSDTPAYRAHGAKRFGMAAAELLKEAHAYAATVAVRRPGSTEEELLLAPDSPKKPRAEFTYVLATLVSSLERAFTISPASRPLDGQLRLVHFGAADGERTMDVMRAAYRGGEHVGMCWTTQTQSDGGKDVEDGVGYDAVDEVRVTVHEPDPRWRKVCIDGTIVELEDGGWMAVARSAEQRLRVLVDPSVL